MSTPTRVFNIDGNGFAQVTQARSTKIATARIELTSSNQRKKLETGASIKRRKLLVRAKALPDSTQWPIYVGDSSVTDSDGWPLYELDEIELDVDDSVDIYGYSPISAPGAKAYLSIMEIE